MQMMKITRFYDSISPENTCVVSLADNQLTIKDTKKGKTTTTTKPFHNEEDALDAYYEAMSAIVSEGYNPEDIPFEGSSAMYEPQTGKMYIVSVEGLTMTTEIINKGKSKTTQKEFESNQKATKGYYTKVWANMKKGYIVYNEDAQPGQAMLHRFVTNYYNGGLGFAYTPQGFFVYGTNGQAKDSDDFLLLLNARGKMLRKIDVPQSIVATMYYHAPGNMLYLCSWHNIYKYDLNKDELILLLENKGNPLSFLSGSDKCIAYGSHPQWVVEDQEGNVLYKQDFDVEILKGAFPFCTVLSKDGKMLAMSCREGTIELLEASSGKLLRTIEGDFPTVMQMEFTEGDSTLVMQETHGSWRIRYFNVATGKEVKIKGLMLPEFVKDTSAFCFNEDESLMVQQSYWRIYVFDYRRKRYLYTITMEHAARWGDVKFVDNNTIGVRTDCGCFSLYKVR